MRLLIVFVVALTIAAGLARAADTAAPRGESGWLEQAIAQIEDEVTADIAAAPDISDAVGREWRSFDRNGSARGVFLDLGWIAVAALFALFAERATSRALSRPLRRKMQEAGEPNLFGLMGTLACDIAGLMVFLAVFTVAQRHVLVNTDISPGLDAVASHVLMRWRIFMLIARAVLRPEEPVARLVDIPDVEAHRLGRFLSIAMLGVITLIGFNRYGLMDEDSGAGHVMALIIALLVCAFYISILVRSRTATEALIRGRSTGGLVCAMREGLAHAWLPIGLVLVAGLLVIFVAGLSLGLLSYYRAVSSTLGIIFVVMVFERLTERVWHDVDPSAPSVAPLAPERLAARAVHRIAFAIGLAIAAMVLVWDWVDAIEPSENAARLAMRSAAAAIGTLFVAFVVWELVRLAIDRHLQAAAAGPGADDDDAAAPASRLQTVLPLLRAAFAVVIGVLATLIVLSRLGVDTAPLIAGAGVFGLAVSFGSQSLVRDIISGLFYMWDDAFRVGEYLDTGRLKGTVETLGIRSVKLRHQNGPLHTIPYGQLGAVTNLSRDFATIKFNLRFVPQTDIELVRKTAKQIGIDMQDEPEVAAEIIQPLKLQGIAEVVDNALVLRFKFTARPVKPSWVQREYLKRIYRMFAEKGIAFASGTVLLQTLSSPYPEPVPAEKSPAAPKAPSGAGVAAAVEPVAGGG
jgi:small-conductance mechanosensitive channel